MQYKRKKIGGVKWMLLAENVTRQTTPPSKKHPSGFRLIADYEENGMRRRKVFPDTEEGAKAANNFAASKAKEKREQGARFGYLSTDEKQAVEIWRVYRDECMREACAYAPMAEVVREAVALFRQKSIAPFFREVAREYVRTVESKGVTEGHCNTVSNRVRLMNESLGNERICHITPAKVEDFLNELPGQGGKKPCKPATRRGYMVLLGAIFRHAIRRGYVNDNPVEAVQKPIVKTSEPGVLSVGDCRDMLRWVAREALAYLPGLAINMFCGVRPAELARVRYADMFPGGRAEIYLSRSITKLNVDRFSKLRNADAWLEFAKAQGVSMDAGAYVLPGETEQRRTDNYATLISKRIKKGCGLQYEKDALRHTAASMLCALVGRAAAADELGHDTHTQAKHYRVAITEAEAKAFFEITPASLGL